MEKIAIISDVHGNITALNAVLDDIKRRNVSRIFCLGDSVGKCVHSDLVVDKLKESCNVILLGNVDYTICKPENKYRHFWTRDLIGEERAKFIFSCPVFYEFYLSGHLIRLFHASPHNLTDLYNPMFTHEKKESIHKSSPDFLFDNTKFIGKTDSDPIPDIIGYGHIHTPFISRYKNKTIFNAGSVGVPVEMMNSTIDDEKNKFSTMSSYVILEGEYNSKDLSTISFQFIRLPYDVEKEIADLEVSDIPSKQATLDNLRGAIPNANK